MLTHDGEYPMIDGIAVVARNWVYIDGGDFSFTTEGGPPNFQYCTFLTKPPSLLS